MQFVSSWKQDIGTSFQAENTREVQRSAGTSQHAMCPKRFFLTSLAISLQGFGLHPNLGRECNCRYPDEGNSNLVLECSENYRSLWLDFLEDRNPELTARTRLRGNNAVDRAFSSVPQNEEIGCLFSSTIALKPCTA